MLKNEMIDLEAKMSEQRAAREMELNSRFEREKSDLDANIRDLAAQLDDKNWQMERLNEELASSQQNYEEQLQRLTAK